MLTRNRRKISDKLSHAFSPLTILVLLTAVVLSVSTAFSETRYVKPSSEIPIRTGQGTEYKILAVVPDGFKVDLIEEDDAWAKVRTSGGTEGWMLKRYLSSDPPLSTVIASLKARNAELKKSGEETRRKLVQVSANHTESEQELELCLAERDDIRNKYQRLKAETSDVVKIKDDLSKTVQDLKAVRQKLTAVQKDNRTLRRNTALKWFLAGGFVLIIGWIIGIITGRSRKRSSLIF